MLVTQWIHACAHRNTHTHTHTHTHIYIYSLNLFIPYKILLIHCSYKFSRLASHTLQLCHFCSSFGSNLQISSDVWENCFVLCITIFGLLLFLYYMGNFQVRIQFFYLFIFYLMLGSQLDNYKAERQWFLNGKNETP